MKKIGILVILFAGILLLIPLTALGKTAVQPTAGQVLLPYRSEIPAAKKAATDTFRVKTADGKIEVLSAEDYLCGVVAAEISASCDEEALKAQAVAAYTFACRRRSERAGQAYDISADPTVDQAYLSAAELTEKWGDGAKTSLEKIRRAVQAVKGYMVTYDGRPALTAYHAISSGKTESAENVWGTAVPYLVAVDSAVDRLAENYCRTTEFTPDEIKNALSAEVSFAGKAENWFSSPRRSDSGTVLKITVCGTELTGNRIRQALSLRSADFEIRYADGKFRIATYGYGHGVGMSQNGAKQMAAQGSDFKEILCKYYPGCKVEKIKNN